VLHELPLEQASLHGYFSRELEPVLTIDPGDSVRLSVPNAGWELESRERLASRSPELDTGHALAGPIEVRGAREGQTLVVGIDDVAPGSWGVTLSEPPHRIDWELDGEIGRGRSSGSRGFEVRLAPILGVLGMPPAEAGVHSTIPPRRFGGNIDCKELVAGTTLFLPIPVDGALFSAGDGHAAQGDGEVSGTAIECPASAQLTLDVRDDLSLEWPVARIDGAWLTFGFDPHLGHAARIAVDGMLDLLEREHGIDRSDALALCSVVVDLHVTQVVNDVLGVHAILRDDAFAR
jgi:acetamidase/formamidase